ncbi:cytidylyltransferase domain-containing protein [Daejeonella sp.]|uniref:acylneuraminate cytidylyltransferase family protein n=1 Tax=Daejeonella sp. TaxID=2805397 RepID=UPI002731DFFB|nr:acylneuraminate cytidylyltransferase family protein [Daejeonella sp.]MDP2414335.1 acylneuraminate cytidylyltransferase family protein [Daejeonella sp.]
MILIYIPARGGSKGIPLKNLSYLNGKPLLYYTLSIAKALEQELEDEVMIFVSSDDEKILDYCSKQGFQTDYKRPDYLSDDTATIIDGLKDALNWLEDNKSVYPDEILLLQVTSPIRSLNHILSMIKQFRIDELASSFSVIPIRQHPNECIRMNEDNWEYLQKPVSGNQRQAYQENFFFIDGSYYLIKKEFLFEHSCFIHPSISKPFILDDKNAIDIDEPEDLLLAEAILKSREQ